MLIESDYAGRLVAIIGRWRAATHQLVAELPTMLGAGAIAHRDVKPGNIRHDDDPGRRARTAMDQVRAQVEATSHGPALEAMIGSFGSRVADHSKGELSRQALAALGTVPVLTDPHLARQISGFVHENVALIRKLEHGTLDHVETMLTRAVSTGLGPDHVAAEIAARFGIAERHARLIAMGQIGRLDSQLTRAMHLELGLTGYIWRHTPQPHPRHHHVRRDGARFLYDAPPADGHPGSLIGCKCGQEPDFSEILGATAEQAVGLSRVLGEDEVLTLPEEVELAEAARVEELDAELETIPVESPLERLARRKTELYGPGGYVHVPAPRPQQDLSGPALDRRQAEARASLDRARAQRPVIAPPGYYVVTDPSGTKSFVSHRTGNRYTEADVREGRLDPPATPGDFPTATVRRKSVLRRIGAAVKRALRIDGELLAPRGFDPGEHALLEGIPPRDLASSDEACVVPVRAMAWRCVAVPEGGDQSGPVTETRLERIRQAWAINAALPPLRVGLLPDGRLLVRDGRHRLLAALEDGRDVLVLFDSADEAEGDGAVQIEPPA